MSRADFVTCTTTSIAGTSGNGAITMSDLTGLPGFADALSSSARMVDYTIQQTSTNMLEKGYGKVSGGVLTRSNIHETWSGTTYNNTSPTALAFGSTPTSGDVVIDLAPTSDAFMPLTPAISTVSSGSFSDGYQLNGLFPGQGNGIGSTYSTGREHYFPYLNQVRGPIPALIVDTVAAGGAGAAVKFGLYEVDSDGDPGPCIVLFNSIAMTTTGAKTDTATSTWSPAGVFRPGPILCYLGMVVNDATISILGEGGGNTRQIMLGPLPRQSGYGWGSALYKTAENSFTTGLPSGTPIKTGYTLANTSSVSSPWVGFKIQN